MGHETRMRALSFETKEPETINWINNFDKINKGPVIFFGNEFFDAIPIKQFKRENNILFEKYYSSFKIIRLLSFYFVGQTLWMARAETFYFFKNIIFLILIYLFTKLFIIFTKNTKLNFNNW